MPIADIPIFSMLKTRMHWHQERQRLLAENVANADTPRFQPRDLTPPDFSRNKPQVAGLTLARTDGSHLASTAASGSQFHPDKGAGYETRPTGNAVSLEDEMLKVASNQMDYQAATALYSRSMGLIKTAMGKR